MRYKGYFSPWANAARKAAAALAPTFFFQRIMRQQGGWGPFCVLSFDCDFPRDIEALPELVDLLDRYGVKASFACIGQWITAYPDEHRHLVAAGHELINHTQTHPNLYHPGYDYARAPGLSRDYFNRIGAEARRGEIEACHATFAEVLGVEPVGYRSPHFGTLHVDDVYPVLAQLGYRFSSSLAAGLNVLQGRPFQVADGLWELPLSPCPRHPYGVFDSWHSLAKTGASHGEAGALAGLFGELLGQVVRCGGLANIYLDPCDMLRSGEMERLMAVLADREIPVASFGEVVDYLDGWLVPPSQTTELRRVV